MNLFRRIAGKPAEKPVGKPAGNSRQAFSNRNDLAACGAHYAQVLSTIFSKSGISGRLVAPTRGPRYVGLGVRLADPTQLSAAIKLAEPAALAAAVRAVIAQRSPASPGLLTFQFELAEAYWITCYGRDVSGAVVGMTDGRNPVEFRLDPPHVLAAGSTRSGKSVLVDAMIRALCLTHSPGDLQLVIVDPNADHLAFERSAHLACPVAVESDEAQQALALAGQELDRRRESRRRDGPRFVVVMDEAQRPLKDGKNLAIAQALAQEGAKYRVHLLAATQKPAESALPGLLANLNNRWVGLVDNARTSAELTGQPMMGCQRLTGKGDFIHVAGGLEMVRLQAAFVTAADLGSLPMAAEPVAWPNVAEEDQPQVAAWALEQAARGPGRPANRIDDPQALAGYLFAGPERVTISMARDVWGLSRDAHNLYKPFAIAVRAELQRLIAARKEK